MIAISYRREDSLPIAGRLYDRLSRDQTTSLRSRFENFACITVASFRSKDSLPNHTQNSIPTRGD